MVVKVRISFHLIWALQPLLMSGKSVLGEMQECKMGAAAKEANKGGGCFV